MNKQNLINKIKQIDGLTHDERAELINLLNTKKKYGLIWEDKPEDVEEEMRTKLPVLREVVEKRILSVDNVSVKIENKKQEQSLLFAEEPEFNDKNYKPESKQLPPNHILIEGDNLHALTALTFTHEGKIDVIYIDPPYNTENKDFKYNDTYVDLEDSFRHSKWLSFMHKRLEIAKRLLSEKGVIFISIDDNEQGQLKMLCDEVFGELFYHGAITWIKKTKPINSGKAKLQLQQQVEYIHTYTRITKSVHPGFKLRELGERKYREYDNIGYCRLFDLEDSDTGMKNRETMKFPILGILPGEGKRWKIGLETANQLINNKLITIYEGKAKQIIYPENDDTPFKPFWSHFSKDEGKTAEDGKKLLTDILGKDHNFDTVKPIQLITEILFATTHKKSIILDFFAGSGTTLHAVMKLNSEDGGNRQCILVTNNENNICEEVTYPRSFNVINGYISKRNTNIELYTEKITFSKLKKADELLHKINLIKENNKDKFSEIKIELKDNTLFVWGQIKKENEIKGLKLNNLRYYKSEFVGRERTYKNKKELVLLATELLCIKEDIYIELFQLGNYKLMAKDIRCFNDDNKYMIIVYNEEIIDELIPVIKQIDSHKKIKIYLFAPGQYPYTEEFEEVIDKVELCALPDAIYKAYANVLPKKQNLKPVEEDLVKEVVTSEPVLFN